MIEQVLQAAAVRVLQDAVIVRPRANDFLQPDHVRAGYHLQKDKLAAKGEHALFPVVGVAATFLENPVIRCHFSGKDLAFHVEFPDCGLGATAEFILKDVVATRMLPTLHSFRLLLLL